MCNDFHFQLLGASRKNIHTGIGFATGKKWRRPLGEGLPSHKMSSPCSTPISFSTAQRSTSLNLQGNRQFFRQAARSWVEIQTAG